MPRHLIAHPQADIRHELECKVDSRLLEGTLRLARPLAQAEIAEMATYVLKPVVDQSKYVNYIRHQGGTTSCAVQCTAAVLDILKRIERPYSPNFSAGFIDYVYNASIRYDGYGPNPNIKPLTLPQEGAHMAVIKEYGCCTEGSLPWPTYDPPTNRIPEKKHFGEAKHFRISGYGVTRPKSLDEVKYLLSKYHALVRLYNNHCMTLLGYDDTKAEFKLLDSYGDQVHNGGFVTTSYADMSQHLSQMCLVWAVNQPTSPIAGTRVGRIKAHFDQGRVNARVRVGVEGQELQVIWDRPVRSDHSDNSSNLALDFLLPPYEPQYWPPRAGRTWHVEVTDSSPVPPSQVDGTMNEVTLVQQLITTAGGYRPVFYRPNCRQFPLAGGGSTEDILIPSQQSHALHLTVDRLTVARGNAILLSGTLALHITCSNRLAPTVPQAGWGVSIRTVEYDPIEGPIGSGEIGTVTTDARGHFSLTYSPSQTQSYQAVATKADGTVVAVSEIVAVQVT